MLNAQCSMMNVELRIHSTFNIEHSTFTMFRINHG